MSSINIKPPIKYTDMAIYIDNHIYTDDCDDEKVFIYLYHLALMLAHKNKLFKRVEYYNDFALSFAEDVYMRLKNPKQYLLKEDGSPKMHQITSVLNFMKKILYGRKVEFEQKMYSQTFSSNQKLEENLSTSQYSVINQINKYLVDFNVVELEDCLSNICKIIKLFLKNNPYSNNEKEWNNIYISCLLTTLNSLVLSKTDEYLINNIVENTYHKDDNKLKNIDIIQNKKENTEIILYHLDDSMKNYVAIIYKKIQKYLHDSFNVSSYNMAINEKNLINITLSELENNDDYLDIYE